MRTVPIAVVCLLLCMPAAGRPPAGPAKPADSPAASDGARRLSEVRETWRRGDTASALALLVGHLESESRGGSFDGEFLLAELLDRWGDAEGALRVLQGLRDRGAPAPLAASALDRVTLLYRTRRLASDATAAWRPDPAYAEASAGAGLRGPRSLAVAPDGTLWVADDRADALVQLDRRGALLTRVAREQPQFIAAVAGAIVSSSGSRSVGAIGEPPVVPGVETPEEAAEAGSRGQGTPRTLRRLGGMAAGLDGSVLLIDASQPALLRYGPGLSFESVLYRPQPPEDLTAVAADPAGWFWVALESSRTVIQLDAQGGKLRSAGPFESVRDIAVDAAGNLYVLDDRARRIAVFDPGARPIGSIPLDATEVSQPVAIAVDPAGAIYVADRRAGRILRLG